MASLAFTKMHQYKQFKRKSAKKDLNLRLIKIITKKAEGLKNLIAFFIYKNYSLLIKIRKEQFKEIKTEVAETLRKADNLLQINI